MPEHQHQRPKFHFDCYKNCRISKPRILRLKLLSKPLLPYKKCLDFVIPVLLLICCTAATSPIVVFFVFRKHGGSRCKKMVFEMIKQGSHLPLCRSHSVMPSWLAITLTDVEEKMKALSLSISDNDDSHSFAERAENYYQKRPQLLSLLQDLYNGYLSLADRHCQILSKRYPQHLNQSETLSGNSDTEEDSGTAAEETRFDSDSYSSPPPPPPQNPISTAAAEPHHSLIAELVAKITDCEILVEELRILECRNTESSRKIELQKGLLEVLESERIILFNENGRLDYGIRALTEENKRLASEAVRMKGMASELVRCIVKLSEDHNACLLNRKIEDLQNQIFGLEKRNNKYYEMLVKREYEEKKRNNREDLTDACFDVDKLKLENEKLKEEPTVAVVNRGVGWMSWKKLDTFICGSKLRDTIA